MTDYRMRENHGAFYALALRALELPTERFFEQAASDTRLEDVALVVTRVRSDWQASPFVCSGVRDALFDHRVRSWNPDSVNWRNRKINY